MDNFPIAEMELGRVVLVSPTVHGNLIVGPTAMDVEDKEANNVRQEGIDFLMEKQENLLQIFRCAR